MWNGTACKIPESCGDGHGYDGITDTCHVCGATQTGDGLNCTNCLSPNYVNNNKCIADETCTVVQRLVNHACITKTCTDGTVLNIDTGDCVPMGRVKPVAPVAPVEDPVDPVAPVAPVAPKCKPGQYSLNGACFTCGSDETGDGINCTRCGANQHVNNNVCEDNPVGGFPLWAIAPIAIGGVAILGFLAFIVIKKYSVRAVLSSNAPRITRHSTASVDILRREARLQRKKAFRVDEVREMTASALFDNQSAVKETPPTNWCETKDSSGNRYYVNTKGESVWELPEGGILDGNCSHNHYCIQNSKNGKPYYKNVVTGVPSWKLPEGGILVGTCQQPKNAVVATSAVSGGDGGGGAFTDNNPLHTQRGGGDGGGDGGDGGGGTAVASSVGGGDGGVALTDNPLLTQRSFRRGGGGGGDGGDGGGDGAFTGSNPLHAGRGGRRFGGTVGGGVGLNHKLEDNKETQSYGQVPSWAVNQSRSEVETTRIKESMKDKLNKLRRDAAARATVAP